MAEYVVYDRDIVQAIVDEDVASNSILLPTEYENYDLDQLRVQDNQVIDVSDYTKFYIDENGLKHIVKYDDNWQELECKWNDVLIKDGDVWKVQNAEEEDDT